MYYANCLNVLNKFYGCLHHLNNISGIHFQKIYRFQGNTYLLKSILHFSWCKRDYDRICERKKKKQKSTMFFPLEFPALYSKLYLFGFNMWCKTNTFFNCRFDSNPIKSTQHHWIWFVLTYFIIFYVLKTGMSILNWNSDSRTAKH